MHVLHFVDCKNIYEVGQKQQYLKDDDIIMTIYTCTLYLLDRHTDRQEKSIFVDYVLGYALYTQV